MKKIATMSALLIMVGCAGTSQTMAPVNTPGMVSATTSSQMPSMASGTSLATGALGATTPIASATGQMPTMGSAIGGLAGGALGSSSTVAQTPGLVDLLVQKLGVTPQQATGGAGSIFSVAQQSLGANKFSTVSSAVPGMSTLLAAAPAMSGGTSSNLLGGALGGGGGTSALGMAALASSFQSLGLGGGMVNRFIPVILQYVQAQGGTSTMGLLQSALMP